MPLKQNHYDFIVAQDTLHHLEPINDALAIFNSSLKHKGRLVVTEENGHCLFIAFKNFSKRGFNKVSYYYDERLKKSIPFGNENARSMNEWNRLLLLHNYEVQGKDVEYIRLYPHFSYSEQKAAIIREKEASFAPKFPVIRELFYFGINFTAVRNHKNLINMDDQYSFNPVEVFAGTQWEAALVKSLLENAEIEAFLKDEIRGTTMPWQVTPGGIAAVKVVVARKDLEVAKQVVMDFETNRNSRED
jgi:hypothetical protein